MRTDGPLTSFGQLLSLIPQTLPFSFILCVPPNPSFSEENVSSYFFKKLKATQTAQPHTFLHLQPSLLPISNGLASLFLCKLKSSAQIIHSPPSPALAEKPSLLTSTFPFQERLSLLSASEYTQVSPILKNK